MSMSAPCSVGLALRGLESHRALRQEALEHQLLLHADHRVPRAAHPHVGDEGGPAREHPLVRGLDVRVRADHGGDTTVEVVAHRVLLARRIAVHVDEDGDHARRLEGGDLAIHHAEGIVEVAHEDASLHVHHPQPPPVGRLRNAAAAARRTFRIVGRPEQLRGGVLEVRHDLALRPDVIAAGHEIDLAGEQLLGAVGGDPGAAGAVLHVGDHEVDALFRDELGDEVLHGLPAGLSKDVSEEQDFHGRRTRRARVDGAGVTICPPRGLAASETRHAPP